MITFLTVIHIATIVLLVICVLLQSGKGAEISASFGGSSQTVFGSSGGINFFQKLTYSLAFIFMATSLILTILPGKIKHSVFENYTPPPSAATLPMSVPASNTASGTSAGEPVKPGNNNTATKNQKLPPAGEKMSAPAVKAKTETKSEANPTAPTENQKPAEEKK